MFHLPRWLPQTSRDSGRTARRIRRRRPRARPLLEQLENRVVLSAWTAIGPAPITDGQVAGGGPVSGRVTGVATDRLSADIIYVATAGGGVWKTTNATSVSPTGTPNPTWTPLTDHLTKPNGDPLPEFMGAIAETRGQNRNQIVYAGMGEANNAALFGSNGANDTFYGEGILVSKNGGTTWTWTDAAGAFEGRTVGKIAIDPSDPTGATAYAAVSSSGVNGPLIGNHTGIWKTTDFGALWTNTTAANGLNDGEDWCDVVVDPHTPSTVYAALGQEFGNGWGAADNGVYKSTDGSTHWSLLTNGPHGSTTGRMALALYDDGTTNELLVSVSTPVLTGPTGIQLSGGQLSEVAKSLDGGSTFTVLSNVRNYLGTIGWWSTTLAIDPTDPNYLYAGGVQDTWNTALGTYVGSPIESFDGGKTWTDIAADRNGNGPHTDDHGVAFDHSGNLIDGNDGGVWRLNNPTNSSTQTWDNLNTNLNITQFEGIAVDPYNANIAYGGSQDNGTEKYTGTTAWKLIATGDGGITRVDPTSANIIYQEYTGADLHVSFDEGSTFATISDYFSLDATDFYAPYVLDSAGNIYYGGRQLYFSNSHGSSWLTIGSGGVNSFNPNSNLIDAIAVAPTDNNVVYVSAGGHVFVTQNAQAGSYKNVNWTEIDPPYGYTAGARNSIAVDPTDATGGTAYAVDSTSPFNSLDAVWRTTDFGAHWTDISSNLPNTPCYAVAVSQDGQTVYVGTDVGVYFTTNPGSGYNTWAPFGTGLPNVQVVELEDVPRLHLLAAGTHGRGMWVIPIPLSHLTLHLPSHGFTEGMGLTNYTVAEFTDSTPGAAPGDFTATVTWGDGGYTLFPAWGSIVPKGNGVFALVVPYTAYNEEGNYTLSVQISDSSGDTLSTSVTVTVADAPLYNLKIAAPPATEGSGFSGFTIATFTDFNPAAWKGDFTATVTWGDGSTSTLSGADGSIVALSEGTGPFALLAGHTYAEEGSYALSVAILDDGGAPVSGTRTIAVADAALTHLVLPIPPPTEGKGTGFVTVATFHDYNLSAPAGDFAATITWGDGSITKTGRLGARIVAQGNGNFAVLAGHTYAEEGTYTLLVQVLDDGGAGIKASRPLRVADAALGNLTINDPMATEGAGFQYQYFTLATFVDPNTSAPATDFTATVNWGDGSTSTLSGANGSIVAEGGGLFVLVADHTYAEEGTKTLSVQILDKGGASISGTKTIAVADAALGSLSIHDPNATEGIGTGSFTVATFTDANSAAPAVDFTATVTWGDGKSNTGKVVSLGGGSFAVVGSHTYADEGTTTLSVQVLDKGGASTSGNATIPVADAALGNLGVYKPTAVEGVAFSNVTVATFTDANHSAPATDFTATVTWGDGTSSAATVFATTTAGHFAVRAGHTYGEEGSATLSVQILDKGGISTSGSVTLTVADAALGSLSIHNPKATEGKGTGTFTVAIFQDANISAPATDFTVTIQWGDGSTTTLGDGGIVALGKGAFALRSSHTYAEEGTKTLSVQVLDKGGAGLSGKSAIVVADAALSGLSIHNPNATAGVSTGTFTVATFHDANTAAPTADFTAAIAWGDGSTSTVTASGSGVVSQGSGNFAVRSAHTYPSAGTFTLSVGIADVGGSSVNGQKTIAVAPHLQADSSSPSSGLSASHSANASPGSPLRRLSSSQKLLVDMVFLDLLSLNSLSTPLEVAAGMDIASLMMDQALLGSGLAPLVGIGDAALNQQIAFLNAQIFGV